MMRKLKEKLSWMKVMVTALLTAALALDPVQYRETHNYYMVEAKKRNAFLAIVIMSVMSLVVGSIFLYIGLFVNVTVFNAIPTGSLTAADNTTLQGIKTNVNTAFTLGGIIMIVIGAAGIITVLLGMVPRGATR